MKRIIAILCVIWICGQSRAATTEPSTLPSGQEPKLQFVAMQQYITGDTKGAIWHPDGSPVDAHGDLDELKRIGTLKSSDFPVDSDRRGLSLWFWSPDFDLQTEQRVKVAQSEATGYFFENRYARGITSGVWPASQGQSGWLTTGAALDTLPATVDVTLNYTAGAWDDGPTFAPDATAGKVTDVVSLISFGKTSDRALLTVNMEETPAAYNSRQLSIAAMLKNGQILNPASVGTNINEISAKVEFSFAAKPEQVASFQMRTRPYRSLTFKQVAIAPNGQTPEAYHRTNVVSGLKSSVKPLAGSDTDSEISLPDAVVKDSILLDGGKLLVNTGGTLNQAADRSFSGTYSWRKWQLNAAAEPKTVSELASDTGPGRPLSMAVTPDGNKAFGVQQDLGSPGGSTLWVYDLSATHAAPRLLIHTSAYLTFDHAAISPDGKRGIVSGSDGTFSEWDLDTGKVLHQFGFKFSDSALVYDAQRRRVYVAGAGDDDAIHAFDIDTGKETARFETGKIGYNIPFCLAISPDGSTLASGEAMTLRVWDTASGKSLHQFDGALVASALAFSGDGKTLVLGTRATDGAYVAAWDLPTGNRIYLKNLAQNIQDVAISEDKSTIVATAGNSICILKVPSMK